jgi:hypothetical protein
MYSSSSLLLHLHILLQNRQHLGPVYAQTASSNLISAKCKANNELLSASYGSEYRIYRSNQTRWHGLIVCT